MIKNINIGFLLNEYIKNNRVSKAALSRALETTDSNLAVKLKRAYMRTDTLAEISMLLEHNFFADIAKMFPAEFSQKEKADTTKDEEIEALKLEIKILERERETLSHIISRKMNDVDSK